MESTFREQLAAANARIQRGNDERTAGADDKARAILAEVERRGRGGAQQLADELAVSQKTISQACARARSAPRSPNRTLPGDTLERLLAAALETVPPLTSLQWNAVAFIVRGTVIDFLWFAAPGEFLADEVEGAELDEELEPAALAAMCRKLDTLQAFAVIDACQQDDLTALPTTGE